MGDFGRRMRIGDDPAEHVARSGRFTKQLGHEFEVDEGLHRPLGEPIDEGLVSHGAVSSDSRIGRKYAASGGEASFGGPLGDAQSTADGGAVQIFERGVIFDAPGFGTFALTGPSSDKWKGLSDGSPAIADLALGLVGWPVGDPVACPGGEATYFERGMIVARSAGQAFLVSGRIYLRYRMLGDVHGLAGLPTTEEEAVAEGRRSRFDNLDIYWSPSSDAHAVLGAIRGHWEELGGPGGGPGFPISDELPVTKEAREIGRVQRCTDGAIYWSGPTGAWWVHGDILKSWEQTYGGPTGQLGFPISDEGASPSGAARYSDFEQGVLYWPGSFEGIRLIDALEVFVHRFDARGEDNPVPVVGGTPQDLYVNVLITASTGHRQEFRMPSSGDYGPDEQIEAAIATIAPVRGEMLVSVRFEGRDADDSSGSDELGVVEVTSSIDTLWEITAVPGALDWHGAFRANFNLAALPRDQRPFDRSSSFWQFDNWSTPTLTKDQFAQTFSDVHEDEKWWLHPINAAFYELAYRGLSKTGNCFGMCLESIYAQIGHSIFNEPISRYGPPRGVKPKTGDPASASLIDTINVRHGYQLDVRLLEWALYKFVMGHTHDPVRAFLESEEQNARGDYPVLSLSNDSTYSSGHALRPYRWERTSDSRWTIFVANPNNPEQNDDGPSNRVEILNPGSDRPTFRYDHGTAVWSGGTSSGGRLVSIPFSIMSSEPRTPGWEIAALLASGVLFLVGGDGETNQITDGEDRTFYESVLRGGRRGTLGESLERTIVEDADARIPGLVRIPFHDQFAARPTDAAGHNLAELAVLGRAQPEIYFGQAPSPLRRPGQSENAGPAEGRFSSERLTRMAPRTGRFSEVSGIDPISPVHLGQTARSMRFAIDGRSDGAWSFAVRAPRMSAHAVVPCAPGAQDSVHLDQLGRGDQTLAIRASTEAAVRLGTIALQGWTTLGQRPKSFELRGVPVLTNQAVTMRLDDGGRELVLQNEGPDVAFELVARAESAAPQAPRSSIVLEAGKVARLRPVDWDAATMDAVPIRMRVLDHADGPTIREVDLPKLP